MRRTEIIGVKQVRQDQIVEMAPVARHQDDRVLLDAFDDLVETNVFESLEHPRPDAVEHELQYREVRALVVGGNLVEIPLGGAPELRFGLVALKGEPPNQRVEIVALNDQL